MSEEPISPPVVIKMKDGTRCLNYGHHIADHETAKRIIADIQSFYAKYTPEDIEQYNQSHDPNETPTTEGFVYLIRFATGIYKIGCTMNLESRMATLKHKYGDLELLHTIQSANYRVAEKELHARFKSKHLINERFALSDEDIAQIKSIQSL